MLLVTGPTGNVGSELVDILAAAPPGPWRVANRHPDRLADKLAGSTGEAVELDFYDRATWPAALAGVETLFLLFPLPGNRAAREAIIPFAEAAAAVGCRNAVYISVFGADTVRFIPHYKVEAALRTTFANWTTLRCSFFMQNLHRALSTHGTDIAERGELFVPAGNGATTFIDARDAAEVAALVLRDPQAYRNTALHLTGSEQLTMTEVAEELTRALGYPVRYTRPGLLRFAARLRRRHVSVDTIGFMCGVYTLTRLGRNQQLTDEVAQILGRPPRTMAEFLRDSAWRWRERAWT